jgi:hypothetical protein
VVDFNYYTAGTSLKFDPEPEFLLIKLQPEYMVHMTTQGACDHVLYRLRGAYLAASIRLQSFGH